MICPVEHVAETDAFAPKIIRECRSLEHAEVSDDLVRRGQL
jgi:hypothetical protein